MNRYNMGVSSMRMALLRPAAKKELTGMADWRTILTDRQTDRQIRSVCPFGLPICNIVIQRTEAMGLLCPAAPVRFLRKWGWCDLTYHIHVSRDAPFPVHESVDVSTRRKYVR